MAFAAKIKTPLPENVMTPDAALERLIAGNARYVAGQSTPFNFSDDRAVLVKRQDPYASILSCSDSRVSPEFCFDEQRGDLFVARIAGNYLTTDFVATREYAAAILHTPLIMALGHESCGAVKAAINAIDKNEQFPGHIQSLASALAPAVRVAKNMSGERFDNVFRMNVIRNVDRLVWYLRLILEKPRETGVEGHRLTSAALRTDCVRTLPPTPQMSMKNLAACALTADLNAG